MLATYPQQGQLEMTKTCVLKHESEGIDDEENFNKSPQILCFWKRKRGVDSFALGIGVTCQCFITERSFIQIYIVAEINLDLTLKTKHPMLGCENSILDYCMDSVARTRCWRKRRGGLHCAHTRTNPERIPHFAFQKGWYHMNSFKHWCLHFTRRGKKSTISMRTMIPVFFFLRWSQQQ